MHNFFITEEVKRSCFVFKVTCDYWQFKCPSNGVCIHQQRVCDGSPDCPDSSDEYNCGGDGQEGGSFYPEEERTQPNNDDITQRPNYIGK